jgi:hypothetical protein
VTCKDIELYDAAGQQVATTRFHTDVWTSEIGGISGAQGISANADMASFVKWGRLRAHPFLCDADLIHSPLPDGERDGANGCHP